MKLKSLFLFVMLAPALAYCQSVTMPQVAYSEASNTIITKVEVTKTNTVVSFKHVLSNAGAWVELNKSIYLQDANSEEMYKYIKSEGIPLRPNKLTATKEGQEVRFKVYFQKLKPGTKAINIIERAHAMVEQTGSSFYFNYYNVSLTQSASTTERVKVTDVVLMSPPNLGASEKMIADTAYITSRTTGNIGTDMAAGFGPMMGSMYTSMLDAQLKIFSKPEITAKLAQVTKSYYDALIKVGFSEDAALKIITAKPLVSMDGKQ